MNIFIFLVAFTLPTLWSLRKIRPEQIDYRLARGSDDGADDAAPAGVVLPQPKLTRPSPNEFRCAHRESSV
jgi:hypothetical protein